MKDTMMVHVLAAAELDARESGEGWDYGFGIVDADGSEWEVAVDGGTGNVRKVGRDRF